MFAYNNCNSGILVEESTQLLHWKVLMEMEKETAEMNITWIKCRDSSNYELRTALFADYGLDK